MKRGKVLGKGDMLIAQVVSCCYDNKTLFPVIQLKILDICRKAKIIHAYLPIRLEEACCEGPHAALPGTELCDRTWKLQMVEKQISSQKSDCKALG